MSHVVYRGCCYRFASGAATKAAQWFVSKLWKWIEKTGVTKSQVESWVTSLFSRQAAIPNISPEDQEVLVNLVAKTLSRAKLSSGDFVREVLKLLDKPPVGYRWEVDDWGEERLIKVRSDVQEHSVVRGKGFAGHVLIGVWWVNSKPKKAAHRSLVKFLRENRGNVFMSWDWPDGGREYGGFVIVPDDYADAVAQGIKSRVQDAADPGEGNYRLSAISLDSVARGDQVINKDKVRLPGINSVKFNWTYNLPDVLNGRVQEWKKQKEYTDLVQMLRDARDNKE